MIYIIWTLLFLGVCTFTDIKEKNIYTFWCIVNAVAGVGMNLITQKHSFTNVLLGGFIGVVFIMLAILTRQKVGVGDAMVILSIGLIQGGIETFNIVIWAFIGCSIVSVVGIITSKMKIYTQLPFMPFLFFGSIVTFLLRGL